MLQKKQRNSRVLKQILQSWCQTLAPQLYRRWQKIHETPIWLIAANHQLKTWYPSSHHQPSSLQSASPLITIHKHLLFGVCNERLNNLIQQDKWDIPKPKLIIIAVTPEQLHNPKKHDALKRDALDPLKKISRRFGKPVPILWLLKGMNTFAPLQTLPNDRTTWIDHGGNLWGPTWQMAEPLTYQKFTVHYQGWLLALERLVWRHQYHLRSQAQLANWHALPYTCLQVHDAWWSWLEFIECSYLTTRAIQIDDQDTMQRQHAPIDAHIMALVGVEPVETRPTRQDFTTSSLPLWQQRIPAFRRPVYNIYQQKCRRLALFGTTVALAMFACALAGRIFEYGLTYHDIDLATHHPDREVTQAYWSEQLTETRLSYFDPLAPLKPTLHQYSLNLRHRVLGPMLQDWWQNDFAHAKGRLPQLQLQMLRAMLMGQQPLQKPLIADWLHQHGIHTTHSADQSWWWLLHIFAQDHSLSLPDDTLDAPQDINNPTIEDMNQAEDALLLYLSQQQQPAIILNRGNDRTTIDGVWRPDILYNHLANLQGKMASSAHPPVKSPATSAIQKPTELDTGILQHVLLLEYFSTWWHTLAPIDPFHAPNLETLVKRMVSSTQVPSRTWEMWAHAFQPFQSLKDIDPIIQKQATFAALWTTAMAHDKTFYRDWQELSEHFQQAWGNKLSQQEATPSPQNQVPVDNLKSSWSSHDENLFLLSYQMFKKQVPLGILAELQRYAHDETANRLFFARLLDTTWQLLLEGAHRYISTKWQLTVFTYYNDYLATHYPFNPQTHEDVDIDSLDKFFGPKGLVSAFEKTLLSPFVVSTTPWDCIPQRFGHYSVPFNPKTYALLSRLHLIQQMFYSSGSDHPHFEFTMVPVKRSANLKAFIINNGGEQHDFDDEHDDIVSIHWPNLEDQSVTFEFKNDLGSGTVITENSLWAWLRLLSQARIKSMPTEGHFTITFHHDGYEATYELIMSESIHPLMANLLFGLQLPEEL